jgi:hypothetical protein
VAWIVRVVKIGAEGEGPATDVTEINRRGDLADIANQGLTLAGTKRLLAGLQQAIVATQVRDHSARRQTGISAARTEADGGALSDGTRRLRRNYRSNAGLANK